MVDAPVHPRAVLRAMRPGERRVFAIPPSKDPAAHRRHLSVLARREWGRDAHDTEVVPGGFTVIRRDLDTMRRAAEAVAPAGPADAMPAAEPPAKAELLTRKQAAAWLDARAPGGMTEEQLRRLAARGAGPRQFRFGRTALYREGDLAAWLRARLRPAERASRAA